jgi:hypothetical protein
VYLSSLVRNVLHPHRRLPSLFGLVPWGWTIFGLFPCPETCEQSRCTISCLLPNV